MSVERRTWSTCHGGVKGTPNYPVRGDGAGGDAVKYGFLGGIHKQNIVAKNGGTGVRSDSDAKVLSKAR